MKRALELALLGLGKVPPNPMVGAVIVKNGNILGEGFHGFYGDSHAEINAIDSCLDSPKGADLYCNLEPCSTFYHGKINPPCCDRIIEVGIKRVFIAQIDPNPMVSGSGVKRLRNAGIEVVLDICKEESITLNRGFNSAMVNDRPFIHLKWAQTLDGQIATSEGVSKWISSDECRKETHYLRSMCDGIIVGRKTISEDNPTLDARYGFSPSPRPIVIDSGLKSDPKSNIFGRDPIIFCSSLTSKNRRALYRGEKLLLDGSEFSIKLVVKALLAKGINSLFVEGGANLITQFLEAGLWDRVTIYTAPKILGMGLSPVGSLGITDPKESIMFENSDFKVLDNHMVFNGYKKGIGLCLQD